MKVWLKLLLGAAAGVALGLFLPVPARADASLLLQINDLEWPFPKIPFMNPSKLRSRA